MLFSIVSDRVVWPCCQDECSFVSLRDVDRTLQVMLWFYKWFYNHSDLFELMNDKAADEFNHETDEDELEVRQMVVTLTVILQRLYRTSFVSQYPQCYTARVSFRPQLAHG